MITHCYKKCYVNTDRYRRLQALAEAVRVSLCNGRP